MRRKALAIGLALTLALGASAQSKKDIVKTGINFGPLPLVAYDADKGLQLGALLNIFNYGDGSNYPNYNSKLYIEGSYFLKGSQLYQVCYDNKALIPGVRWSSSVFATIDHAMDFYGFNGYRAWFDQERFILGQKNKKGPQDPAQYQYTPFYRANRIQILGKTDFVGNITDKFKWEAGYHFSYFKEGAIDRDNINKGKPDYNRFPDYQPTLFEMYRQWGLISDAEADGGFTNTLRLGLTYDSRDKEGAPTRGTWAEAHVMLAPSFLSTSEGYYRYSVTVRQYVPILDKDRLTFAIRANYEGAFGNSSPYYILPYITVMGENTDKDGMGGYRTVRGLMRDRVVGLDMLSYNAEFRWRFLRTRIGKQNIALGLNLFSDGTMVTRERDMSYRRNTDFSNPLDIATDLLARAAYEQYMAKAKDHDTPHITVGAGFRFIMNENFIVAVDYGMPTTHLLKSTHPLYNQDGTGAFYVNTGYLF